MFRRRLEVILGDGVNQVADLASGETSIPSWNLTPRMTFGNWADSDNHEQPIDDTDVDLTVAFLTPCSWGDVSLPAARAQEHVNKRRHPFRGSVTLLNIARNKSPGTSGSRGSDDFTPRLHGRFPEGSVRSC